MNEKSQVPYRPMIRELPLSERPRERLQHAGAGSLSNAELLAIILRIGGRGENVLDMAQRLLSTYHGLGGLARASCGELATQRGVGTAKAAQMLAAFELGKRLLVASPDDRPQVTSPADAANLLMAEMSTLEQEHMRVLLLDTKHRVLASPTVYKGNVNTAVIRVGELFRDAVKLNCPAMIVAHNHPSGDPTPSAEDVSVTRQLTEAGKLLGIDVLDHIVVGDARWVSLKERGLGW